MVNCSKPPGSSNLDGILSLYLKKKRMQMILPFIPPGANILDIGCDNGSLLEYLPTCEFYLGLDSQESIISRNKQQNKQANISFVCANFNDFAWQGSPFNLVVMTAVLEHLEDISSTLFRLKSITTQNALVLLTTPTPISRFILRAGAAFRFFARDSLHEHKNYFRKSDFQHLRDWKLERYKRFEFRMNQLVVLRKQHTTSA
jgi:2-polyprenyl-3-methyl-5-hydroxy-6-metoxy-1,4-benzoquinol methylase